MARGDDIWEARAVSDMMPKGGGPPRRPDREVRAGLGSEDRPGGPETPSPEAQSGRYRLIAAQQASAAPGAGAGSLRFPPPLTATTAAAAASALATLPSISNPSTLPAAANARQPGLPPHHDEDAVAGDPAPELVGDETATLAEYPYSIYNHGTWTADDDKTLIQARTRGQNWADLQRTHFPTKTANACRKRYERLVERRGIHDYSGRRLETVANEYMNMRKEVWSGLADRVGMKWEAVEALVRCPCWEAWCWAWKLTIDDSVWVPDSGRSSRMPGRTPTERGETTGYRGNRGRHRPMRPRVWTPRVSLRCPFRWGANSAQRSLAGLLIRRAVRTTCET